MKSSIDNENIDVILVYPKTGIDMGATVSPPHSLLTIAAPVDASGYKVKIIDQRIDNDWDINQYN